MWSRHLHRAFIATILVSLLQGCVFLQEQGFLGGVSVDQGLLDSDVGVTRAMQFATDLRQKKHIPDGDWPAVKKNLKSASIGINQAWAAYDQLSATHGSGEVTFEERDQARSERRAAETLMEATP